jgi:hypothetical protein
MIVDVGSSLFSVEWIPLKSPFQDLLEQSSRAAPRELNGKGSYRRTYRGTTAISVAGQSFWPTSIPLKTARNRATVRPRKGVARVNADGSETSRAPAHRAALGAEFLFDREFLSINIV